MKTVRKRRLVGLILLVSALFSVEAVASHLSAKGMNRKTFRFQIEKAGAVGDGRLEVLVLGDSSANAGVDPVQLGRAIGMPVSKVAMPARASWMASAYLLERYLRSGRKPRHVVLILSPYYLEKERV